MSSDSSVPVGGEVLSYCGSAKCKMDLWHVVIAKVGDKIVRAQCLTCKAEHAYRRPKDGSGGGPTRSTRSSKTKKAKSSEANPSEAWAEAIAGVEEEDFLPYTIRETFEPGDKIRHKKFGRGAVLELTAHDKIKVLFQDGARVLVMGR